jgi:phosphoadenosine phosphosulfate reductase
VTKRFQLLREETQALLIDSISLLQEHEPAEGYYGCFSGGKDSVVIKAVAQMAGVKASWHYNKTTIDPPELVRFIRREHPDVAFERPPHGNFFKRMEKRGFPTRRARWCCEEFKEGRNPKGAVLIMGIRSEESPRRAKTWKAVQEHWRTKAMCVLPILGWASDEVWEFIRYFDVPYCSLYDEGFHRLGCIGCPMAREAGRRKAFDRWPRYEARWKKAFQCIWSRRSGSLQRNGKMWFGDAYFDDWEELWEWWVSDKSLPKKKRG